MLVVKYSESGRTAGGCLALVPGKLDWSPGVASRHEVGILPSDRVNCACISRLDITLLHVRECFNHKEGNLTRETRCKNLENHIKYWREHRRYSLIKTLL